MIILTEESPVSNCWCQKQRHYFLQEIQVMRKGFINIVCMKKTAMMTDNKKLEINQTVKFISSIFDITLMFITMMWCDHCLLSCEQLFFRDVSNMTKKCWKNRIICTHNAWLFHTDNHDHEIERIFSESYVQFTRTTSIDTLACHQVDLAIRCWLWLLTWEHMHSHVQMQVLPIYFFIY